MKKEILDGCTAAAHVAYALSDVATIYPITPVASMGETAQQWGLDGRLNLMGQRLEVREMESELGAAGAVHGAAVGGALATTFTASQGLMLMIPNMFKIAGELFPVVFHIGCRTVASHALSVFGDHQDVMACRATGFAMLASASVQEAMDLALVAHLAAIEGRVPVIHFFDGKRTSGEMNTIDVIDYESMRPLVNWQKVQDFRRRAINPEHPELRGSAQNPDTFFQNSEAANTHYQQFPATVQQAMDKVAKLTGRQYHLVDYFGAPDAETVIVIMASGADVAIETVEYLQRSQGAKVGVVKVRLYRPFPAEELVKALPATVKHLAVLDRTKEPGAQHEPLCLDVISALRGKRDDIRVVGGRYGLSSKEFNPSMVKAVLDFAANPTRDEFTVGITDDVTHLSLEIKEEVDTTNHVGSVGQAIFYGIGNDGSVGGTKETATVLADTKGVYAQAYFIYSAKKSGGYTISQLRTSTHPITSAYSITSADYLGCHKASYVRRFSMVDKIKPQGIFVINCPWADAKLVEELPLEMRRAIASKQLKLYTIDADAIAAEYGLAPRINMPMETVYLYLTQGSDFEKLYAALGEQIQITYCHEGEGVVNRNLQAISKAVGALREVDYSKIEGWTSTPERTTTAYNPPYLNQRQQEFIERVHKPSFMGKGDSIPVSAFSPDGTMPMGTTAYEHRRIATRVPVWNPDRCVECTECSLVCPHAAIRPYILTPDEAAKAPSGFATKPAEGAESMKGLRFRIQNFPTECLGCSSCSLICPGHALTMTPIEEVIEEQTPLAGWAAANIKPKTSLIAATTVNGSQLQPPLLEFSGACAGCGETPYVKLLTQLFGPRLIIANATGCSSVWGADYPSNPFCTDAEGHGPAWANSLFEDNAEYGYGILIAMTHRRQRLVKLVKSLVADPKVTPFLKEPMEAWLSAADQPALSAMTGAQLVAMLSPMRNADPRFAELLDAADLLAKKSIWTVGGDGWAYDIGFAGLDHVLASQEPAKMLVLDTECYSNTGGQTSKATPRSAVAKYSPDGKSTEKKDLGRMMMTYGSIYVASIALGANYQQAIDALIEAERYPGPALVIAYCPCLNHGIHPGLGHSIVEQRRAVEAGYWPLYRFNPQAAAEGRDPLTIDSVIPGPDHSGENGSTPQTSSPRYAVAEPMRTVHDFLTGDTRYTSLEAIDPLRAGELQSQLQIDCDRAASALKH